MSALDFEPATAGVFGVLSLTDGGVGRRRGAVRWAERQSPTGYKDRDKLGRRAPVDLGNVGGGCCNRSASPPTMPSAGEDGESGLPEFWWRWRKSRRHHGLHRCSEYIPILSLVLSETDSILEKSLQSLPKTFISYGSTSR